MTASPRSYPYIVAKMTVFRKGNVEPFYFNLSIVSKNSTQRNIGACGICEKKAKNKGFSLVNAYTLCYI